MYKQKVLKRVAVHACSGAYNSIRVTSRGNSSIAKRLGVYVQSGDTLEVTRNYATALSSTANFNIFLELFSMGYSSSITAGINIGWKMKNSSSVSKELVIYQYYDRVNASHYYEVSPGLCALGTNGTYTALTVWGFG